MFWNNTYYGTSKHTLQNTYCIMNRYEVFRNNKKYQDILIFNKFELIHLDI